MFLCIITIKDDLQDGQGVSDGKIILAYFFYCFSTLNQTFALSTVFSQPKLAGELGSFIQAISSFIYYFLRQEFVIFNYYFYLHFLGNQ